MQNDPAYRIAKRHVERKLGFFTHLAVYLVVNAGLILLNYAESSAHPWSVFPLFGWGIGLACHGLSVFLRDPTADWKQRMIAKELEKVNRSRS